MRASASAGCRFAKGRARRAGFLPGFGFGFFGLGLFCWLVASAQAAPAVPVELVIGSPDAPQAFRVTGTEVESGGGAQPLPSVPLPQSTPLGSLWKLFVFTYMVDRDVQAADYRCTGRSELREEEAYCCAPGESIDRDTALVQSCGLYFQPTRLGIDARSWADYWRKRPSPEWLRELSSLAPGTEVSVVSLLQALSAVDEGTRVQTMRVLQKVTLDSRARPLLAATGSRLRIKTWSWRDARGQRIGGFAGWLANGSPVWLRGGGTSASVIERIAPMLNPYLPETSPADESCVSVRFFNRYPLASVRLDGQVATAGPLRGQVEVRFKNGQQLRFAGNADLRLREESGTPYIEGRFGMNDYVGRVIQREAASEPVEAARALGVAARTYLVRHAGFAAGCYRITDDSRTQRVSPQAASRPNRLAAEWSDGLILRGVDGRYHSSVAKPMQLSWQQAVQLGRAGSRWDEILADAYGPLDFALLGDTDAGKCQPLPQAETWLASREQRWKPRLQSIPGFDMPDPRPRICRLHQGNPYADIGRGRIYVYGIASENDRLAIAHEYLHFALSGHPRGRDEAYVEQLARQLLGVP